MLARPLKQQTALKNYNIIFADGKEARARVRGLWDQIVSGGSRG